MDAFEYAARMFEPAADTYPTPGALAAAIDPSHTVRTPALDLIDAALVRNANTPNGRLIISMPPQEGKSTRVAEMFPLWLLHRDPDMRIVLASYSHALARRNGRMIRNHVITHPDIHGLRLRDDVQAQHEWQIAGHRGGIYAVGVGGSLTGRPADALIIDDPIKDMQEASSAVYRARVWDWWTAVGSTRLAQGASVALILTRWHHEDLAGKLLAAEDGGLWHVLNIPAQADHDPAKNETDPLGREPGDYMISARGRTTEDWDAIKKRVGPTVWAALYQGRPTPNEGGLFPRDSWSTYTQPMWLIRDDSAHIVNNYDELVQSWDLTFKDTAASDYVVGQIWMRRGTHAYLLDQTRARMTFTDTINNIKAMTAKWPQATAKFVEDKANGPAVINALARTVPGLIPIEPEGSKYARANAVSPLVVSHNVHIPDPLIAPWAAEFVEEAAAFPNGAHDDQVDTFSQAINRILLQPLQAENLFVAEEFTEIEARGYAISPY